VSVLPMIRYQNTTHSPLSHIGCVAMSIGIAGAYFSIGTQPCRNVE
jgi:hypothetical protein